jgi:hypothetical protein
MAARDGSTTFSGDLESLEVVDHHTKETKFPTLIAPLQGAKTASGGDKQTYFFTSVFDKVRIDACTACTHTIDLI